MPDAPDERDDKQAQPPSDQHIDWLAAPDDDFSWDDSEPEPPKPKASLFARSTERPAHEQMPEAAGLEITPPAEAAAVSSASNVGQAGEQSLAPAETPAAVYSEAQPIEEAAAQATSLAPVRKRVRLASTYEVEAVPTEDQPPNPQAASDTQQTDSVLPPARGQRFYQNRENWVLLALIIIAAVLRFNGLMYDNNGSGQPQINHPDERFIATSVTPRPHWDPGTPLSALFDPDNSPISTRPGWQDFAYGSLPIYITRIAAEVATRVTGKPWSSVPDIVLVGRFMSGLVDIGTMLLVFLIGRRLYSTRAGLFAAAIICFSVLNIQLAHFYATDSFVTFFFILTLFFAVKFLQDGRWGSALWMGAGLGFAIASKFTIAPLALVIFVTFALRALYVQRPQLLGAAFEQQTIRPFAANPSESPWQAVGRMVPKLIGSLVASLVAFEIGEPYALFRLPQYFAKIGEQNNIMKGLSDVPYTRQYIGTMPVIYQLGNLTLWGLGIIMGAVVMVGLFFILFRYLFDLTGLIGLIGDEARRFRQMSSAQRSNYLLTRVLGAALIIAALAVLVNMAKPLLTQAGVFSDSSKGLLSNGYVVGAAAGIGVILFFAFLVKMRFTRPGEALLFSAALPYAALIFTLEAKWARYMLPLVPIFAIFAAGAVWTAYHWAKNRQPASDTARRFTLANGVRLVAAIAIVGGILWSAAFEVGVYGSTPTFAQTTQWVQKNIPADAVVGTESWDEGIPGVQRDDQHTVTFQIYDTDRPGDVAFQAFDAWINGGTDPLSNKPYAQGADYIILASNRLYMTVPKMPWRYPVAIRYYDLLFNGQLGYQKVFEASRYPSLFGITINDDHADETFTVYDHPKIMIFKKVRSLSDDELKTLFGDAITQPQTGGRTNTLTANNPGPGEKPVLADKTITLDQPVGSLPAVQDYAWNGAASNNQWLAVALWLLVLYLLSFITLPLTWGIFRWLPDRGYAFSKVLSLVLVAFFAWLMSSLHIAMFDVWAILVSVAIVALMSGYFWVRQRHEFLAWLRGHLKLVLAIELIFLAAYFFQLWLRTFNPDLWGPVYGGERPMEFAFLNGVLRSPYMPPQDPFFAGGTINYYYYGYVLLAVLIKLTGIIPTLAFNLSMALIFALAFSVIASVVYNTVVFAHQRNRSRSTSLDYPAISATGLRYGVLGGTLAMLISNVFGGIQALYTVSPSLFDNLRQMLTKMGVGSDRIAEGIQGGFNFWTTSRIIPGTITEFPFWSFLYGDLHPHLISIPVQVMTLGFALNFAFDKTMNARWRNIVETNHTTWQDRLANFFSRIGAQWSDSFSVGALRFIALAITAGSLAVINSWDFPTGIAVLLGGLLIAILVRERVNGQLKALISYPSALIGTILLFGAIVGAALTFYLPFYINFKVLYSKLGFINPSKEVVPGSGIYFVRTQLSEYLVIWGFFILIALAFLLLRLRGVRLLPEGAEARSLRPSAVSGFIAPGFGGAGSNDDNENGQHDDPNPAPSVNQTPSAGQSDQSMINHATSFDNSEAQFIAPDEIDTQYPVLSTQQAAPPVRGRVRIRSSETHQILSEGAPVAATIAAATNGDVAAPDSSGVVGLPTDTTGLSDNGHAAANAEAQYATPPAGYATTDLFASPTAIAESPDAEALKAEAQDSKLKTQTAVSSTILRPQRVVRGVGLSVALPGMWPIVLLGLTVVFAIIEYAVFNERLLGFLALIIGLTVVVTFGRRNDRAGMATGLFLLAALAITTGTELVYLADHLQGGDMYRMNTVFKFYEQAWIYFSLAAAMGLFYIFDGRDEALLAPMEETAASAAAVGDDPHHIIESDTSSDYAVETVPPVVTETPPSYPPHPYMISEWGQDGIEDTVPYFASAADATGAYAAGSNGHSATSETGSVSDNGHTPATGAAYMAGEWGQTGADEQQAQASAAENGNDGNPTPPQFEVNEAGQTGSDDEETAVTNDYAPDNDGGELINPDEEQNPVPLVQWNDEGDVEAPATTPADRAEQLYDEPVANPDTYETPELTYDEARGREEMGEHNIEQEQAASNSGWGAAPADEAPAESLISHAPASSEVTDGTSASTASTEDGLQPVSTSDAIATQRPVPSTQRAEARGWWGEQFHPPSGGASTIFRVVFTPLFLIGLLLSLGFNVYGTPDRLKQRFDKNPPIGTLNGIDWMKTASIPYKSGTIIFSYEYDAINWLLNNVNGTPVVAQAPEEYYRSAGDFVAMMTGFPTIIGPMHEGEQRYSWQVDEHNRDADNLFNPNTDVAATQLLMSKYDVQYVYVGQVEHLKYSLDFTQPTKFDDMVTAKQLEKVYSNDRVSIYHVAGNAKQQAGTPLNAGPRPTPTPRPTATPVPPGFDTKLDALRKKVADSPNDESAHIDLANYLRQKGDVDGAVAEYKAAVAIHPDDVGAWQMMGDTLHDAGRDDEAIAAWKSGTDSAPNSPDMWNKLGIGLRDYKHDYDAAADAFNHAIQANSGFGEAYYNLGVTMEKKGDTDSAKKAYQDGIDHADNAEWKKRCQDNLNALQ